ncbi:zf-HC2 domain-containing protein [Streptomyces sp. NPDC047024]|uniref:zf-HC2 domain-containing protein n=1 Tax=Streptomyces sp. NPDC047024 TaxID=3155476 RepID=UPI0033E2218B
MTKHDASGWHVTDTLAARYADDTLPEPDAWSLEKHLEHCAGCAVRVSGAVRATAAGAVLGDVRAAVLAANPVTAAHPALGTTPVTAPVRETPVRETPGHPLRTPRPRFSRLPRLARLLWAAGPAVRGAWLPAVLGVAAGAMLLGLVGGFAQARVVLLAIAPVLPVAGVALSYGPHADPLYEITAATPGGGLRLALTRTTAVLAVSLPLLTLTGLLLPASGAPAAAAWLLPGLALSLATLALASFTGCRTAAGITAGGWLCAVLAPLPGAPEAEVADRLAEQVSRCLDGAAAQGAWAAATVLGAALLAARRPAYDRLPRR